MHPLLQTVISLVMAVFLSTGLAQAAPNYRNSSLYAMVENGIMKIDTSTGAYSQLNSIGTHGNAAALTYGDGFLYAMTTNAILKIDTSTGVYTYLNGIGTYGNSRELVYVNAVPEPETYAMLLVGLGLMSGISRRHKH